MPESMAVFDADGNRITIATNDAIVDQLDGPTAGVYVTTPALRTARVLGATTGAIGDYISHLVVIPASVSPGVVTLLDNAEAISVFAGGAGSLTNLAPFIIPLGMHSLSGPWKLTTGASVSVIAVGNFT